VVKQYALRAIIGRDPGTLLTLADAPQLVAPVPSNPDAWAHNAEQSNPLVAQALAGADIARIEVQRQKRGWGPTLDLQGQVGVARESGSTLVQPAGTSRTGLIGLQLVVPIYTGGLVQSQVRAALASEDKAQQDLEFARRNAGQGARQAYTGAVYGLEQIRALESARVSAQSQLDSTITGYKVGVRVNVEVLDAETQLFNTQRDLKKARYDFLINGLKLQSAVGELDERDLEAVNRMLVR
jgi:outer membrane protein